MSNNKQSKKYLSLVTYCLALVCLLLGLFLPLFDGRNLLFMMLPDAFCTTFGLNATELGDAFTRAYPIIFTGTTKAFDFAAFAIVMYAFVTAVGIIMLIPVIASNSEKKTANVCAYIVEIAAAVVLFMYTVIEIMLYLTAKTDGTDFNWDYGVIGIAFGGVLLMLIIQSFGYKKGSGFMKLIVFILGAAGVLATVAFTTLVGIKETSLFDGKLFISFFGQADGISALTMLLTGGLDAAPLLFGADDIKSTIAIIAVACAVLLALVNFALDMAAIGATTKKGTLVTDIIRYALETVALILAVIMIFVINQEGIRPGLLMYALLAIAVIQLVIASIRCAVFRPAVSKETNAEIPADYYDDTLVVKPEETVAEPAYAAPQPAPQPAVQPQPQYIQPVYLQPVYAQPAPQPAAQPAPAPQPSTTVKASSDGVVYTAKEVYRGPTDSFMSRLTDSEKIEFSKLFLEKINGSFANVPDYVIGGDNKEFFSSIFIYLGKFRPMLSDGLMNKFYNELNLLN